MEKKFAKHIGPEEFVQCSQNLIKDEQQKLQSNYDVPAPLLLANNSRAASTSLTSSFTINAMPITLTTGLATTPTIVTMQHQQDVLNKKKTCNLENYFEWSNRLRLLVANEILQVSFCHVLARWRHIKNNSFLFLPCLTSTY